MCAPWKNITTLLLLLDSSTTTTTAEKCSEIYNFFTPTKIPYKKGKVSQHQVERRIVCLNRTGNQREREGRREAWFPSLSRKTHSYFIFHPIMSLACVAPLNLFFTRSSLALHPSCFFPWTLLRIHAYYDGFYLGTVMVQRKRHGGSTCNLRQVSHHLVLHQRRCGRQH